MSHGVDGGDSRFVSHDFQIQRAFMRGDFYDVDWGLCSLDASPDEMPPPTATTTQALGQGQDGSDAPPDGTTSPATLAPPAPLVALAQLAQLAQLVQLAPPAVKCKRDHRRTSIVPTYDEDVLQALSEIEAAPPPAKKPKENIVKPVVEKGKRKRPPGEIATVACDKPIHKYEQHRSSADGGLTCDDDALQERSEIEETPPPAKKEKGGSKQPATARGRSKNACPKIPLALADIDTSRGLFLYATGTAHLVKDDDGVARRPVILIEPEHLDKVKQGFEELWNVPVKWVEHAPSHVSLPMDKTEKIQKPSKSHRGPPGTPMMKSLTLNACLTEIRKANGTQPEKNGGCNARVQCALSAETRTVKLEDVQKELRQSDQ